MKQTKTETARAAALVEEVLRRSIRMRYEGGTPRQLVLGEVDDMELVVRLHSLPWQATLTRAMWTRGACDAGWGRLCSEYVNYRLPARLGWRLHRLARYLRCLQKRRGREYDEAQKGRELQFQREIREKAMRRMETRLAQQAAEGPKAGKSASCPQGGRSTLARRCKGRF